MKLYKALIVFVICLTCSQAKAETSWTASRFLADSVKGNKTILFGKSKELPDTQTEFLLDNRAIEEIVRINVIGFTPIKVVHAGIFLDLSTQEISIASYNGDSVPTSFPTSHDEHGPVPTILPKEAEFSGLPLLDEAGINYLIVLESKQVLSDKTFPDTKITFYTVAQKKAAFRVPFAELDDPKDPHLSDQDILDLSAIIKLYKLRQLNSGSATLYQSFFARNLIKELLTSSSSSSESSSSSSRESSSDSSYSS